MQLEVGRTVVSIFLFLEWYLHPVIPNSPHDVYWVHHIVLAHYSVGSQPICGRATCPRVACKSQAVGTSLYERENALRLHSLS